MGEKVIVGTIVMHKTIAHPTGSQLLNKSRGHLVKAVQDNGLRLRQNYNRVVRTTLRTRVSRVHREVRRQLHMLPEAAKVKVQDLLQRAGRILSQRTKDKNKLYALHAPEVECISKGKARIHTNSE